MVSVPKGKAGDTRSWIPNEDRSSVSEEAKIRRSKMRSEPEGMTVTIIIPTALRQHTNNEDELQLNSRTSTTRCRSWSQPSRT